MGGFALNEGAYAPLDVYFVRTLEFEGEAGEIDSGHFLCYNPYQVLNDLNKFDQDKYLGEILKKQRKAKANQISYDVDLLNVFVKENEIIRPEDPNDRHPEMYDPDESHLITQIHSNRPTKVNTKDLCNYIDNWYLYFEDDVILKKYGKQVIVKKLGSIYEPQSDEVCLWSLNRNQLSRGHNGDADDMVYYYLSWNAHVDDYFYSSYSRQ